MKCLIFPLLTTIALFLAGCAGDFQSTSSEPSATIDTSSIDNFNETQQRINEQMALDAANAAAAQQFNDAMAAAQQTMNQHNDEFNALQ